jgi:hypothetical protein
MENEITSIKTFGDVRHLILQTIMNIRDGGLDTNQAMVMAAHFKCLNDNVNAEVNAAKVAMSARREGLDFGSVVQMGQRLIGGETINMLESK